MFEETSLKKGTKKSPGVVWWALCGVFGAFHPTTSVLMVRSGNRVITPIIDFLFSFTIF
ncbi:hypothetical protein Hanom_Chr14g01287691 [Helianthus anomalus]